MGEVKNIVYQKLEIYQLLFLLNYYFIPNMGEKVQAGEDTFEAFRTQFTTPQTPKFKSSPDSILSFIARAIQEKDGAVISLAYGNLNTGATGRFSGFSSINLSEVSGRTLTYTDPHFEDVKEKWTNYARSAMSSDQGFCSRKERLSSTVSFEGTPVLNVTIHCHSSESQKTYSSCNSEKPYKKRTCSVQLRNIK